MVFANFQYVVAGQLHGNRCTQKKPIGLGKVSVA